MHNASKYIALTRYRYNYTNRERNRQQSVMTNHLGESGALRSGVWFRANNLMIMMTQHNFCLLFD